MNIIEQTPDVLLDIVNHHSHEDILIITDHKNDFYVIDKELPNEVMILAGKSIDINYDYIMSNLTHEHYTHVVYSATGWEWVYYLFNKLF